MRLLGVRVHSLLTKALVDGARVKWSPQIGNSRAIKVLARGHFCEQLLGQVLSSIEYGCNEAKQTREWAAV